MGVALAMNAGAKHLCLFHSEPTASDEKLEYIETRTRRFAHLHDKSYPLKISQACEGLEIDM